MEWWVSLIIMVAGFIIAILSEMPVAFAFGVVNLLALFFLLGPHTVPLLAMSIGTSISNFTFIAIPLFILMGEVIYRTGLSDLVFESLDQVIGGVRARLAIISTIGGVIFAALTGSSMASCATIGSVMLPEMRRRKYDDMLSLGCILCVGPLAVMIPPSSLMVIFAAISGLSVADLLIGGILPGVLIGVVAICYIVIVTAINPELAPKYGVSAVPRRKMVFTVLRNIVPISLIIFLVIGTIYLGVATPSEAAGCGAMGTLILAVVYRKLTWQNTVKSLTETAKVTAMVMFIITSALLFGRVMLLAGVTTYVTKGLSVLNLQPWSFLLFVNIVLLVIGFACGSASAA